MSRICESKKYVKIASMEGLQKAGEALLAFANIVTALVFLKSFWLTSNQSDLIGGAIFWIGTYVVGIALINFANRRKQNE